MHGGQPLRRPPAAGPSSRAPPAARRSTSVDQDLAAARAREEVTFSNTTAPDEPTDRMRPFGKATAFAPCTPYAPPGCRIPERAYADVPPDRAPHPASTACSRAANIS